MNLFKFYPKNLWIFLTNIFILFFYEKNILSLLAKRFHYDSNSLPETFLERIKLDLKCLYKNLDPYKIHWYSTHSHGVVIQSLHIAHHKQARHTRFVKMMPIWPGHQETQECFFFSKIMHCACLTKGR